GNHMVLYPDGINSKTKEDYIIDGVGSCSGQFRLLGDPSGPGGWSCGDPVNLANGNLFERVSDYQTARQNKLAVERYYNRQSAPTGTSTSLGPNWRSNFDRFLRLTSGSAVTAERPDGQQISFLAYGGGWVTDSDLSVKLTNSATTWTFTDRDDTV